MNDDVTTLKAKYNKLLQRYKKAEEYVDCPGRTKAELGRWMPEFMRIVKDLNITACQNRAAYAG